MGCIKKVVQGSISGSRNKLGLVSSGRLRGVLSKRGVRYFHEMRGRCDSRREHLSDPSNVKLPGFPNRPSSAFVSDGRGEDAARCPIGVQEGNR